MPIIILYLLAFITVPVHAELSLTIHPIHPIHPILTIHPIHPIQAIQTINPETQETHGNNSHDYTLNLHFPLKEGDCIYHDYISLSTDSPDIMLSDWNSSGEPIERYDVLFKKNKLVYIEPFTLTLTAQVKTNNRHSMQTPNLHCIYYKKSDNNITHQLLPLIFTQKQDHTVMPLQAVTEKSVMSVKAIEPAIKKKPTPVSTQNRPDFLSPGYKQALYPLLIIVVGIISTIVSTKRAEKHSSTRLTYIKSVLSALIGISLLCIYLLNAAF
ncbi:MAG: hypothetical protein NT124_02275 [Candidatus Dependentiae bacterium]|nr:hypothetical protein [Candidatus Dependentiae bacterium]